MSESLHFLDGGGDMGRAIATHNWSATPIGPIGTWPSALKVAVGMMVNSRFPKCIVWGRELTTLYNDGFKPILGDKPEALGRSFRDVWSEVWEDIGPIAERAFAGEATFIEDFPLVVQRYGYPEQVWFTFCYSPIRDEAGTVVGMMDTVIETTSKMESERNARLLNAELAHRMKNVLAMIAAVAGQTFRSAETLAGAHAIFSERVAALGEAHAILTQSSWSSAPGRAVVEGALAPHRIDPTRLSVSGPPIELGPRQALSMALAINELATNAFKYGALSCDGGTIEISWQTGTPNSEEPFHFQWREQGGPVVQVPARKGFGTRLIERVIAQDFGASVSLDYDPAGFRYAFATTMARLGGAESAAG